jgi:NADH-quinone oxidoreductase subunit C
LTAAERVSPDEALERARAVLGDKAADAKLNFGQVDITVDPDHLRDVATTLRDADDLRCLFFTFLSAVDRSEFGDKQKAEGEEAAGRSGDLEVLVHLYSPDHVFHVNIHVPVDFDEPVCPSISGIYAGALWHERETREMFGVHFEDHPRLVNLYLSEDFEGHPLRKSFRLPSRFIKEWPGAKDPEEAAAGGR